MSQSHRIGDGYDVPFYIKAEPGLYPELRGERRLTLTKQRMAAIREAAKKNSADDILAVYYRLVERKITGWDAKDEDGKDLPISSTSLAELPPALWDRLWNIVMGNDPGDKDPKEIERDELDEALGDAGPDGDTPHDDALATAAEKNSAAG